jgi:NAD(P)-dependent dehydrogenase (short-subunit alcohol dehydrogenase family)
MTDPRRVWLITGCSAGFGNHLAHAALAAGDAVMATARDTTQLADLAETGGDHVRTATLDVTDEASIDAAILQALDADNPPLRLALGADAVAALRAHQQTLRDELDRWENLSTSTDLT